MSANITLEGVEEINVEFDRLLDVEFEAVKKKQLTEMLNRARQPGGTPVDTGELRLSSGISEDEMGYTKEYAPHVEYGHRTVDGGYVEGQYFLKSNVDIQKPIYQADLLKRLRGNDDV